LVRCGTSPAFNYGEVQGAESPKDFIHKMRIILKRVERNKGLSYYHYSEATYKAI
jgi:hypothetical protein